MINTLTLNKHIVSFILYLPNLLTVKNTESLWDFISQHEISHVHMYDQPDRISTSYSLDAKPE